MTCQECGAVGTIRRIFGDTYCTECGTEGALDDDGYYYSTNPFYDEEGNIIGELDFD